jgi:hypothetical protein
MLQQKSSSNPIATTNKFSQPNQQSNTTEFFESLSLGLKDKTNSLKAYEAVSSANGKFNQGNVPLTKLLDENSEQSKQISAMEKDLDDTKEKLRVMTQKFGTTRKERDQLKTEGKEL